MTKDSETLPTTGNESSSGTENISDQLNTGMLETQRRSNVDLHQQIENMSLRIEGLMDLYNKRNPNPEQTVTHSSVTQSLPSYQQTPNRTHPPRSHCFGTVDNMSTIHSGHTNRPIMSQLPTFSSTTTFQTHQPTIATSVFVPQVSNASLYSYSQPYGNTANNLQFNSSPYFPQLTTFPYISAPASEANPGNNVNYSSYQSLPPSSSNFVVSGPSNPPVMYVNLPPTVSSASSLQNNPFGNGTQTYAYNGGARRKLHDLPDFHGRPEEWPMFVSTFRESTNAFAYTNLENMFRLQKSLKGKARETVESLLILPNTVEEAMEQLEFQFGRPEHLIRSQINLVRGLPSINENHLDQIIPFAIKVKNFATFLQSSDGVLHLANPMLMDELLNKLPMSKRIEWAQYSMNIQPFASVLDFSNWINQVARVISKVVMPSSLAVQRIDAGKAPHAKNKVVLHATKSQPAKDIVCSLCGESHGLPLCTEFKKLTNDERWEHTKSKRLCFSCLKPGHTTYSCRARRFCGVDSCRRSHNALLHSTATSPDSATKVINSAEPQPSTSKQIDNKAVLNCSTEIIRSPPPTSKVLFKVVPVKLFGPNKSIDTFALLDDGSSITMMDENLAQDLELMMDCKEDINLQWFGDLTATQNSSIVKVDIRGKGKQCVRFQLQNVRTVKGMQLPVQSLGVRELMTRYSHLRNVPLFDYTNAKPRILIGLDNCQLGITQQVIATADVTDPIVIQTKLGWVLYGPSPAPTLSRTNAILFHQLSTPPTTDNSLESLHEIVRDYFTTENFGVKQAVPVESDSDARAREILENTTVRIGERYETGLLWRDLRVELPDSFDMAMKRLQSTERRMQADMQYGAAYRENIRQYIKKGYARKLSPEEARLTTSRTWYLPHFGVTNPSKPNKLRLVFDAAAEVNGTSLNSVLLTGPDQNQPLTAILHRFRVGSVAICGDIREMFHQVHIRQDDQNSQRFLWRDGDSRKPVETYIMIAMTFGATCSPCSAQFVKNSNANEFMKTHPQAVDAIINSHYVDDYVASFRNEVEARAVTASVIEIHKRGGFELRNFVSNCHNVADEFNQVKDLVVADGVQSTVNMNLTDGTATDKILGMYWNTQSDEFQFELKFHRLKEDVLIHKRRPTKRELLSHAMSIFDPFGFLADFVIYTKLIIQNVWKSGIGWDETISDKIYIQWKAWQTELQNVSQFRISRCYSPYLQDTSDLQLHVFVDASESAFAAVAYLRLNTPEDLFEVAFVTGKTKCAPQKLLSVPRLELQAAVLGVRLRNSIIETHKFNVIKTTFWSDSNTVIQWIKSDHRRYKPFVAHRIAEILASTEVSNWRWIPTELNCADDATRAKYPPVFDPRSRWIHGPEFLQKTENDWPKRRNESDEECQEEIRPRALILDNTQVSKFNTTYLSMFSSYRKLLRLTAWWRRFIKNLSLPEMERRKCSLLASEISEAELFLCRTTQREVYPEEYDDLMHSRPISSSSALFQLSPCLNEADIITVSGRIDVATFLPLSTRRPIILPKKHPLTALIVNHYHQQFYHQNQALIIAEIRHKFWIPQLGNVVRECKNRCQDCKLRTCQPVTPLMGQLPIDRLEPYVRPFTYTGFDYFGPVFVTIGRRREKRWVALFTCLTVRAIHVELASDLSTDSCIICINNFVNRRGLPTRIRSDNGTNFVGADRELRTAVNSWDQDRINTKLANKGIEWVFNCPANPSSGGCWERMVGIVKRVLLYTIKEIAPRVETMRSLLIEAENIVNSRPLTHLPISHAEDEPLTPNHFLLGIANSIQTPAGTDFTLVDMRKQWRISQQLKECFWRRWLREYLPTLTRRTKWHKRVEPLKVDDLVLICETDAKRRDWIRGRVVKVYATKDGQVRTAEVKTTGGVLRRPASKLAVLDVGKSQ